MTTPLLIALLISILINILLYRLRQKTRTDAAETLATLEQSIKEEAQAYQDETKRAHDHYQSEANRIYSEMRSEIDRAHEQLKRYEGLEALGASEEEAVASLTSALEEAAQLRVEAQAMLERAREEAKVERANSIQKARDIREHAEAMLARATLRESQIIEEAHHKAAGIGGDAYRALREKDHLDEAIKAIRNVIEGYGDQYVKPSSSIIDDLAADFGHTEAGIALATARERSRSMVEQSLAADCDYSETRRRENAIRFVIDAFNGRVDSILTDVKHDNFGTLERKIQDAFYLVNLTGQAFRNARIKEEYLESRLTELQWAVAAQELKLREREEQRRIREQIREEERARREYEKAIKSAQKEEALLKRALEKARSEVESATVEQRLQFERKVAELSQKLLEAEAKNQRALSMAQQTKKGNVYIISNIGSFGEGVFKIGMTRRLEPMDRVKELGDASVPFEFDVHAIIPSDDAPALEYELHVAFDSLRVNQVNRRKEFFRVALGDIREFIRHHNIEASFTMVADAHDYRESLALEKTRVPQLNSGVS